MEHDYDDEEEDVPPPPSWRTPPDPFADEDDEQDEPDVPEAPSAQPAAPRPQLAHDDEDEELDPDFGQLYPGHQSGQPIWQRLDKRAVIVGAALVAVLLWLLVGLGGGKKHAATTSSSTTPSAQTAPAQTTSPTSTSSTLVAFRHRADASCTTERRQERALDRRYRRAKTHAALVAYSRGLTASFASGQSRLAALKPPAQARAAYSRWLAKGRQALALERRSTSALEHGHLAQAASLAAQADRVTASGHALARRLGFAVCGR